VRSVSIPAPKPVPASFRTMLIRALTFFDVFVRWALYLNVYDLKLHQDIWGVPHVESLCRYISRTVKNLRIDSIYFPYTYRAIEFFRLILYF
jgi:hypothetical protein